MIQLSVSGVAAQESAADASAREVFFYHGLRYGSEATFNPISILLNEGFDIVQLDGWSRRLLAHPYAASFGTVLRSVAHPFRSISRYGLGQFLTSELLPMSTRGSGGGQWVPNYQLHLVGGGMVSAALREWYELHGFDRPMAWSVATAVVYHLLNETVENGSYEGYNVDAVADLYVFDVGGILLFSSAGVRRFFGRTLNLRSWPLQASLGLDDGTVENAGQYYSIQWRLPGSRAWHLFYYFGMNNMLGLTRRYENGHALSVAGGLHARRLVTVDSTANRRTADLVGTAGVFLDRNHSLLVSLVYSGAHDRRWSLNVYPGVLPGGSLSPGVWVQLSAENDLRPGIALRWLPGVTARVR